MKKKLFTLLICAFAWIGVNAARYSVTSSDGTVTITKYAADESTVAMTATDALNLDKEELNSNGGKTAIAGATSLKLVGYFSNSDFDVLKEFNSVVQNLDLSQALINQGTVNYTYYYIVETKDDKGQTIKSKYVVKDDGIYAIGGTATTGGGASTTLTKVEGATVESLGINIEDKYIFTAEVTDGQALPSSWNQSLTTLSLPENDDYNVIGYKFANSFTKLANITIPDNVKVIGNEAFYKTAVKSIDLNNVEIFCYQSFYQSKLESVTLPYTTTYVGKEAFDECNDLKTVIFANNPDKEADSARKITVKDRAFFNSKAITDVYIKTLALADCENGAFDYYNTWGHGDPTKALTTLHFASEVANHYANLSHPLTPEIAKDPGRYHQWLGEHFLKAAHPGANGWWEFVNNGTSSEEDDIPGDPETGKILRTFSDYHYDRIVPQGMKAYIVTGLQENSNGDYTLNLLSLLVIPKRTGVILYGVPNSTNDKNNKILSMPLCEIANGVPLRRDYWDYLSETDKPLMSNYLWPTCVELSPSSYVEENYWQYDLDKNGNIKIDDDGDYKMELKTRSVLKEAEGNSKIKPYDNQNAFTEPDNEEEHYKAGNLNGFFRNFLMNRYGNTDSGKKYKVANGGIESNYVGFFRAKKNSQMKPGMAYLRLKDDEYKNPNGGEAIIIGDVKQYNNDMKYYQIEYDKDGKVIPPSQSGYWIIGGNPDMKWENDDNWGDRTKVTDKPEGQGNAKFMAVTFYGEPEIIDNGDGTATMIVPSSMIQKEESGVYYNLQGVKVANPTKGIYIKNGKKIVFK